MNKYYIVKFLTKEESFDSGRIATAEDTPCWVTNEDEGWVEATSRRAESDNPPHDVKIWESIEEANDFMSKWNGHPWYHVPKSWEVLEVITKYKTVFSHYEIKK